MGEILQESEKYIIQARSHRLGGGGMSELPCMRDKCIGRECANFGERGCKGGEHPPWSWSKWYLEELPKIKMEAKQ